MIPPDRRSLSIAWWLQGRDRHYDHDPEDKEDKRTALEYVPQERIWKWIDADIENRVWYFADLIVPKSLFREEGEMCLAREMLVRYGHMEQVRGNFSANYSSGGFSGLSSFHWAGQKRMLQDFKKTEDNQNVRQWIDEYTAWLDKVIEQARIDEERKNW